MSFCDKMREERKKKGLSQRELGEKVGMSQQMIAQYENGNRNPKKETIEKIAIALEVPASEFLGYNNPSWVDLFSGGASCANVSIEETLKELGLTSDDLQSLVDNQKENEKELLTIYRKLNDTGQEKALEQVEMLTKIEEYTKKED